MRQTAIIPALGANSVEMDNDIRHRVRCRIAGFQSTRSPRQLKLWLAGSRDQKMSREAQS